MVDLLSGLRTLDAWGFLLINRTLQNPLFDLLMPILSTKRYALLPAAVGILLLMVWGGRRMWVLLAVAVAAVALSDLGTNLIKAGFQRIRPCHVIPDVHVLVGEREVVRDLEPPVLDLVARWRERARASS